MKVHSFSCFYWYWFYQYKNISSQIIDSVYQSTTTILYLTIIIWAKFAYYFQHLKDFINIILCNLYFLKVNLLFKEVSKNIANYVSYSSLSSIGNISAKDVSELFAQNVEKVNVMSGICQDPPKKLTVVAKYAKKSQNT